VKIIKCLDTFWKVLENFLFTISAPHQPKKAFGNQTLNQDKGKSENMIYCFRFMENSFSQFGFKSPSTAFFVADLLIRTFFG
jgi:hypothetical protein